MNMRTFKLEGMQFERLRVKEYIGNGKYVCECKCGNIVTVLGGNLRSGATTSCGCFRREKVTEENYTHKSSRTRLHGIWKAMRKRCRNENDRCYHLYGGRGIKVCNEWEDFAVFRDWALQNGYSDELTIDRINANGDYSPENCRWATILEQGRNKRETAMVTINGETKPLSEYAAIYGVPYNTALHRMKKQHLEGEEIFKIQKKGPKK